MATQAQIDANRRNSRHSTGPKSAEGKRVVRNNALKHGLCSEQAVIKGEDPAEFAAFADDARLTLEECDTSMTSVLLIERIIRLEWKLLRLPRLEKLAMDQLTADTDDGDLALLAAVGDESSLLAKLERYEMRLSRELRACRRELDRSRRRHSHGEVQEAWRRGFNSGVIAEAEARHREEPWARQQPEPPARSLEAVEMVIEDEPAAEETGETESAEQSQFPANARPGQGLHADCDVAPASAQAAALHGDAIALRETAA